MEEPMLSQKNFAALSQEVQQILKQHSWLAQHGFEFLFFGLRLLLFIAGWVIFAYAGIFGKIVGLAIMSYAYYGISITGTHESRHNAFVASRRGNVLLGYFFGDFVSGESSVWWYNHHVLDHHVYTNIYGKDEDYFIFPWINKYIYFFVAPYLAIFLLLFGSLKYLWKQWREFLIYCTLFTTGFIFQVYIFTLAHLNLPWAIACTLIMRSLYTPIFMHLALFNHIGLEKFRKKIPWLPHQTKTTRNLKPNWFLVGMGGNAFVHRHIEHHLFPSISNRMLKKINPLVERALRQEGYVYIEETYSYCLRMCLMHYKKLFIKGPPPLMVR